MSKNTMQEVHRRLSKNQRNTLRKYAEERGLKSRRIYSQRRVGYDVERAGVKWGIGRELYTAPFIFLDVPTQKEGTRYRLTDLFARYDVSEVEYDKFRRIRRLVIVDGKGKTVFTYPRKTAEHKVTEKGGCEKCTLKPEDREKIGYTEEQLEEVVVKMTGKRIGELNEKECSRLRDWIDKVYEKRMQTPFPEKS